jgi:AcrR family transcriptional regulator
LAHASRPPGRPRRKDQTVLTEVAIVMAAADLFMEEGYSAVTMERVAERAGVTKAALYYHFPNKPALLVAGAEYVFRRARQETAQIMAWERPLRDRLIAVARIVLGLPPIFSRFEGMMSEAVRDLSSEQITAIRQAHQSVIAVVEGSIQDAAARGEIHPPDGLLAAHAYITLLTLGHVQNPEGRRLFPDPHKTAALIVDTLWRGIGPRPGSP